MINKLKKLNIDEILLILFPIMVLFRSSALNFYLILCGLMFIYKIHQKKNNFNFNENLWLYFIGIFFVYTFTTSFYLEANFLAAFKTLSILKFILFGLFIYSINLNETNLNFIFEFISFIIFFVCIDTFIQFFLGSDIFGFKITQFGRLGGPFGDELIVGAFLTFLSLPIVNLFLYNFKKQKLSLQIYYVTFIVLTYLTVLISGERMNFIIISAAYTLIMLRSFNKKIFLIFFSSIIIIFIGITNLNSELKLKYNNFYDDILNLKYSNHGKLIYSSIEIWQENKIIGVGLKNYRNICKINKLNYYTQVKNICSTHPHNTYFEILVETGLIGLLIFLFFLFFVLKKLIDIYYKSPKKIQTIIYGSALVIFFYVWPIRSNGSFFSTFNGSFFWFNLGIILLISKIKVEKN
tara:strand:+ start:877 stop:2100 length:1224 start_codon:yes stop_codon:yes gene_type:complete